MGLDNVAVFPTSVWDGDSGSRDSDNAIQASPTREDYIRAVEEIAALQTRVYNNERGADDDTVDTIGTLATVSGLTAVEKGDAALHKTVFTLVEVEIATVDGVDPTTDGAWGTTLLYTFPEGHIVIEGGHQTYITAALEGSGGIDASADLGVGVGTVAAANSTEWGLSTTEENIAAEVDVDLTTSTSDAAESSVNAAVVAADGSASALAVYLNVRGLGDDDHDPGVGGVLKVSGTITVVWSIIGND